MLLVVCAFAPRASAITSARGRRTVRLESNCRPLPDGRKMSVWSSAVVQCPAFEGTRVGSLPASTRATGAEKVNLIVVSGPSCAVGLGETSTTGRRDFGNQVTPTRGPSLSHGRAAAASATEPAEVLAGSVTVRPATCAPATDTR